jgi:hypothetical protein
MLLLEPVVEQVDKVHLEPFLPLERQDKLEATLL